MSTNIVLGGIAIILSYVWFRRMYAPRESFIGILILGSSPILDLYMLSSMSHVAARCVQSTVLILSTRPERSNAHRSYLAASLIAGLGIIVRFDLGQMSAIEIVRRTVPVDSILFTPTALGLLMELAQDPYDVRDSIMLLGPHADSSELDPVGPHRDARRLQSAQSKTMRKMNPKLLPKLLDQRTEVYAVLRSDQHGELSRQYPVEIELLGTTDSGAENYSIDRIRKIDSVIE